MSHVFTRSFRTRWADLDANGLVSTASYPVYLVETAYSWGDSFGITADDYTQMGIFWVLRETEFRFLKPLRYNEPFDFSIWLAEWMRVSGTRCFELTHKETGEIIAQGTQTIVPMSLETMRPTTPPGPVLSAFKIEQEKKFTFTRFPKVEVPINALSTRRVVEWSDMDPLEHVNNATYLNYVEEVAAQYRSTRGWPPDRFSKNGLLALTRRFHIRYSSPALWGETLSVSIHTMAATDSMETCYIGITRAADNSKVCECILDWELVDRKNHSPQPIPDELRYT